MLHTKVTGEPTEEVLFFKEYMESEQTPIRCKVFERRKAAASPELRTILEQIDLALDKAMELCHNVESEMETDLLRARYVLGMD